MSQNAKLEDRIYGFLVGETDYSSRYASRIASERILQQRAVVGNKKTIVTESEISLYKTMHREEIRDKVEEDIRLMIRNKILCNRESIIKRAIKNIGVVSLFLLPPLVGTLTAVSNVLTGGCHDDDLGAYLIGAAFCLILFAVSLFYAVSDSAKD